MFITSFEKVEGINILHKNNNLFTFSNLMIQKDGELVVLNIQPLSLT